MYITLLIIIVLLNSRIGKFLCDAILIGINTLVEAYLEEPTTNLTGIKIISNPQSKAQEARAALTTSLNTRYNESSNTSVIIDILKTYLKKKGS